MTGSRRPTLSLDDVEPESLGRRGVMSVAGLVVQNVAKFATSWIAGLAGPVVLGAVAVAMSTGQLLSLLGPTSIGAAASKYMALALGGGDLTRSRATARHLLRLFLLLAGPLSAAGGLVSWLRYDRSPAEAVTVALLTLGLSGYAVSRGFFFGHRHIGLSGWWDLATAAIAIAGTAILWFLGTRSVVIVLPLALGMLLYTWAGWPRGAAGTPEPELRADMDQFTLFSSLGSVASAGFVQASLLAAHAWGGETGAGLYSSAFLLAAPLTIMVGAANQVLYPSMAEALGRGDHTGFARQLARATTAVVVLMTAAIGVLAVASALVIRTVWGQRYAGAEPLLPLLLLGVLLNAVGVPGVSALTTQSARGARLCAAYAFTGSVLGLATWLAAGPRWGLPGVAAGFVIAMGTTSALVLNRLVRDEQAHFGPALMRLALGIAAAAVAWWVPRLLGWPTWTTLVAAALFAGLWVVLTLPVWRELLAVVGASRRGRRPTG